ncbi:methionine ABC transporter substrate-binding protein, partial [Escherichia coli]|nr:methionine ABC transporter substrate-binding protein [Escherichia coli]
MKKIGLVLLVLGCVTLLAACGSGSAEKTDKVKIGASPTPHAEILE